MKHIGFSTSPGRFLGRNYEEWDDLQPSTENPAEYIGLAKIVPGPIQSIPDQVPTKISKVFISLSPQKLALGGSISANIPSGPVPQPYLGDLTLDFEYAWRPEKKYSLRLGVLAGIEPVSGSEHLYLSALTGDLSYEFATESWYSEAENMMPFIDSIELNRLEVEYLYKPQGSGTSVASISRINCISFTAGLELDLSFDHTKQGWEFMATLKPHTVVATLGQIITGILGEDQLDLPRFPPDMQLLGFYGVSFTIKIQTHSSVMPDTHDTSQFTGSITFGPLEVTFAYFRDNG
jgi:hypothetical protein